MMRLDWSPQKKDKQKENLKKKGNFRAFEFQKKFFLRLGRLVELRPCRRSDDETSLVSAEEGRAEREFEEEKFSKIF